MEEQVSSGEVDAAIVATHMMLEATELGLGSVWVGWFPPTETAKALGAATQYQTGYAAAAWLYSRYLPAITYA